MTSLLSYGFGLNIYYILSFYQSEYYFTEYKSFTSDVYWSTCLMLSGLKANTVDYWTKKRNFTMSGSSWKVSKDCTRITHWNNSNVWYQSSKTKNWEICWLKWNFMCIKKIIHEDSKKDKQLNQAIFSGFHNIVF